MKTMPLQLRFILLTVVFISLAGCGEEPRREPAVTASQAREATAGGRSLNLFNWVNYLGKDTIKNFEAATGIAVNLMVFESEETMLGRVQSESGRFDLVVASEDTLRELSVAKLLTPISYDQLPNFKHVDPRFLHQRWDPRQQYSVPYLYGSTGVVVNTKFIPAYQESWNLLLGRQFKGRTALLREPFEAIGAVNKFLGNRLSETDPEKLAQARSKMSVVSQDLHGYHTLEEIMAMLREEELWASQIYSGDGMSLVAENDNFKFFIPKEGAAIWIDMFFIPAGAQNVAEAHLFLDYILQPEVNAAIASELWYATTNKSAEQYMDPEVLASPAVYPPAETLEKCEMYTDVGNLSREYKRLWVEMLSLARPKN